MFLTRTPKMPALPTFAIFEEEYSISKKPEQINKHTFSF